MAKGYWIARVDIHDPEAYKAYLAANGAVFRQFGARYLVRGGASETVEGSVRQRNVILEFPSYADALACYRSAGVPAGQGHAHQRLASGHRHRRGL